MKSILLSAKRNLQEAKFTYLLAVSCLLIYIAIHLFAKKGFISDSLLTQFGAPLAIEIYDHQYWGILTNSFVHYEKGHLILNLIALLLMGSYVERRIGLKYFLLFGLYASIVSSAIQLAFSDDAGFGMSGVNYGFFGFIFTKSFIDKRFRLVTKNIAFALMFLFIPFCEYMNIYHHWNVGTFALFGGFFTGVLMALFDSPAYRISYSGLSVFFIFALVSLFYNPFSSEWYCAKGIQAHEMHNLSLAKSYYFESLTCNPASKCANENLTLIRIDELSSMAFKEHNRGHYLEAKKYYEEIIRLDPHNQWAMNNLNRLP